MHELTDREPDTPREVVAWFAEPDTAAYDRPDSKCLAHQIVEADAARDEVASSLHAGPVDRREYLGFDQSQIRP